MSIWVTLEMTVQAGKFEELHSFLEDKLPAVRGFDGALSVSLFYDQASRKLLILEEWKSREHHGAYIASIQENGVLATLVGFMTAPPEVQYYERLVL